MARRSKAGKLLVIEWGGKVKVIEVKEATLSVLQEQVGGMIEPVHYAKKGKFIIIVNEEGMMNNLPIQMFSGWQFHGNVLIVRANGLGTLTDEELSKAAELYGVTLPVDA